MASKLFTARQNLPQREPPEGRAKFPLGPGAGGGDGIIFTTGAETYQIDMAQVPEAQQISGIRGGWADATNMAAGTGKNLCILVNDQLFVFPGGQQGYFVCATAGLPRVTIFTQGADTGSANVHMFNYNPFFTGSVAIAAPSGGIGGGGSGGLNAGGGGGISGGGSCFTPETLVVSEWGERPISSLKVGDSIRTARGTMRKISNVEKVPFDGLVFRLSKSARATANHPIWLGQWIRVGICGLNGEPYKGDVFNLETDAEETQEQQLEEDTEHSFQLACGLFAHNGRYIKGGSPFGP